MSERVSRVVVIGAGAAGATCAGECARRGLETVVVEAKAFPRAKVCGEYVSPAATALLESLLGVRGLTRAGAQRVDRFVLQLGAREWVWRTPRAAWALSRRSLDELLLERARGLGARVVQPMAVREVEYAKNGVGVTLADGRVLEADVVIHADGSGRHDPAGATPTIEGVVGHKCHLRLGSPVAGVGMRAGRGAYVGTVTVEDGLSTVALVAGREHIRKHAGNADAMLADLWPGYDPSTREGDWMACGVARSGYLAPGHERSVRIGNAAAAVDPVGGEGIGLGLWAGVTAAGLLAERPVLTAQAELGRRYRARVRWRRPACRFGAWALMRPGVMRAMWPVLEAAPGLTMRPWYRMTGKPV